MGQEKEGSTLTSRYKFVALTLIALAGAAMLWLSSCSGGLNTPEGVTVELLRAMNQHDQEVDVGLLDTTNLPLALRFLIASSEDKYGLIVSADADGSAVPSCFPASAVTNQVYMGYRCLSPYPYPLWVWAPYADPSSGALSFTRDGERNQFWVAATKDVSVAIVSVTPSGYTVGAPRQFFFRENATLSVQITVQGLPAPSLIVIGQYYYVVIIGSNINWTNFTGVVVYTIVDGVKVPVGNLFYYGQPVIVFSLVPTTTPLTCYFEWGGITYVFVIGGGSGNVNPVVSMSLTTNGLTVTGDATGTYDPDGSIANYSWNFGDGISGNGIIGSHTYVVGGTYTVKLTVIDNQGGTTTRSGTVTVSSGGGSGTGTINVYPEEVQ